jgi:hypothetical protein
LATATTAVTVFITVVRRQPPPHFRHCVCFHFFAC